MKASEALCMETAQEFRKVEPTGKGNQEVKFKIGGVRLAALKGLKGGHLKGSFSDVGDRHVSAEWLFWRAAAHDDAVKAWVETQQETHHH